jgi:hypothetical protein
LTSNRPNQASIVANQPGGKTRAIADRVASLKLSSLSQNGGVAVTASLPAGPGKA